MNIIYGLSTNINPQDIRYIGKTNEPLQNRLNRHISQSGLNSIDTYKNRWIKSELLKGNKINIIELYKVKPDENWQDIEIKYIAQYKINGYNLTNTTIGGDGIISDEIIKKRNKTRIENNLKNKSKEIKKYNIIKIDEIWHGSRICICCKNRINHKSKTFNQLIHLIRKLKNKKCLKCKSFDRKHTEETKNKISISKQFLSDETKLKFSKLHKGKIVSKEVRLKISNTLKGKKQSDETKTKIANKHKISIICLNNNKTYDSIKTACNELNCSSASIIKVLNGILDNTKGYKFIKNNI